VFRAQIVGRKQKQWPRQCPESCLERAPVCASESLVALARAAFEQQRDVRPSTALGFRHGRERGVERTVGMQEVARGVERVPDQ
jgi:hypothetical protein